MDNAADTHHEETDVDIRAILAFGGGLVLVTAIICFLLWLLFSYFEGRETQAGARDYPLAADQQNRLPPEPRLQTDPKGDLRDLRSREEAVLTSYGWVDKDAGVVRIPIDQAIRLAIERGLPARAATETK